MAEFVATCGTTEMLEEVESMLSDYFSSKPTALVAARSEIECSGRFPSYLRSILNEANSIDRSGPAVLQWAVRRGNLWLRLEGGNSCWKQE